MSELTQRPDLADALADHVVGLTTAAEAIRSTSSLPLATGTFMSELAHEKDYAAPDPWGDEPLMAARNLAVLALVGAIDHAKGFALTLREHLIFAPSVGARATAEAAAAARYLAEDGIGPRERVRRLINERLFSIHGERSAVRRLHTPETDKGMRHTRDLIDTLLNEGAKLKYKGHQDSDRSAAHLDTRRPSATQLVTALFDGGDAPDQLGAVFYHMTSSTSHSLPSGLVRSMEIVGNVMPGLTQGQIGLRLQDCVYLTFGVVHALNEAMLTLGRFNGWNLTTWEPKNLSAVQTLSCVMNAHQL